MRISEKTVSRLQKKGFKKKRVREKRKKKLNRSSKMKIRNAIRSNPFLIPKDLVQKLNLNCSPETIRAYLVGYGMSYRNLTNKEPLNDDKKKCSKTKLV